MAIYHFAVTVISRARGDRIVASAAAQSASALRDDYYGVLHNHTRRPDVDFAEILAPADAPAWVFDREQLWNRVEAAERRRDSQLARAVEISLPLELTAAQRVDLLRDFIRAEFVAKGMIADVGIRRSKLDNPNAHVLLTLRAATATGFGLKMRQWNGKRNLLDWRAAWANRANLHLARAGHRLRIDHRTLDEQQIELTPSRKTGLGRPQPDTGLLPEHLQARISEQRRIAHANGAAIIEDAAIAIRALAQQRRAFTQEDIGRFLRSRSDGDAQHQAALSAILACSELVALPTGEGQSTLYTSRDLIEAEKSVLRRAHAMAARRPVQPAPALPELPETWAPALRAAFIFVMSSGDFKAVALPHPDTSELLAAVRRQWQAQGRRVLDVLSQDNEGEALGKDDVLVVAGAEMIDLKPLEKILAVTERARAKLVLIAEVSQLQAMGAMSAMQDLVGVGRDPAF